MVIIRRTSPFTQKVNLMELPLTESDYTTRYNVWKSGALLHNAFPMLNADQREFVKTGITPEEWDKFMGGVKL